MSCCCALASATQLLESWGVTNGHLAMASVRRYCAVVCAAAWPAASAVSVSVQNGAAGGGRRGGTEAVGGSSGGGAAWAGDMHPTIGFPPGCNVTVGGQCAPTYETLAEQGALWPCPDGNDKASWPACEVGTGTNPLCHDLSESQPCCCPLDGCYADPLFNTIIGVCKGDDCACGSDHTTAPSCGSGKCGTGCTGPDVACCFGEDVSQLVPWWTSGSEVVLNYIAAFQVRVR